MARRVLLQRIGYVSRRQERNRTLHEIFLWQGLELLIRSDSVDRAELEWMAGSSLWQAFEAAEVSPDDVVLDLGAHIGSFALLAASRRQCMVVGFEPDQESLRLCRINISLNALENRIVCHRFAIGGRSEPLFLYEATENWAHTIVDKGGPHNILTGRRTEVPCLSLADAIAQIGSAQCAFLKFNIEGAEFDMIENADGNTLRLIKMMAGDMHPDIGARSLDPVLSRLADAGFSTDFIREHSIVVAVRQ